jgi:hypothetical protein
MDSPPWRNRRGSRRLPTGQTPAAFVLYHNLDVVTRTFIDARIDRDYQKALEQNVVDPGRNGHALHNSRER